MYSPFVIGDDHPDRAISALLSMAGFSPAIYRALYPDLVSLSDEDAVAHFCHHGLHEGRYPGLHPDLTRARDHIAWLDISNSARTSLHRAALVSYLEANKFDDLLGDDLIADVLDLGAGLSPVHILGDSHTHFFDAPLLFVQQGLLPLSMVYTGSSAKGLGNPRSRAGYGPRIAAHLKAFGTDPAAAFLFKFGQVDIEFVYNFKRIEAKATAFDMDDCAAYLKDIAEKYIAFVRECSGAIRGKIAVLSVFPPALTDESLLSGYVNGHIGFLHSEAALEDLTRGMMSLELPDMRTRTDIHRLFNGYLADQCRSANIPFIDEFDAMLADTGTLSEPFMRHHRGTDHHLDNSTQEARARIDATVGRILSLLGHAG